jgi:hypothetical protein
MCHVQSVKSAITLVKVAFKGLFAELLDSLSGEAIRTRSAARRRDVAVFDYY